MGEDTKACPHCGEEIKTVAIVCRHCKTDLKTGQPAGAEAAPKKSSGSKIIIIVVCVAAGCMVIPGILAAILLPAFVRATERAKITSCANNLSQLWKMQNIYMSQSGGRERQMPIQTGSDFWAHLKNTPTPLIDPSNADIYLCPVLGAGTVGIDLQYYGPGKRVSLLGPGEPVGSDDMKGDLNGVGIPNHGDLGGNIIRKSGDVIELSHEDWRDLSNSIGGGAPMTPPIPQ